MKTEPHVFSINDLRRSKNKTACWDGVRNFQARNFLRDQMKVGDGVLFYHSSTLPPGIAGEAVVAKSGHLDPTQKNHPPIWYAVDVKWVRTAKRFISLDRLKKIPELKGMLLLKRGVRLSVQPVTGIHWQRILALPEWHQG